MPIIEGESRNAIAPRDRQRTYVILGGAAVFTLICFAIFLNDVVSHHNARVVLGVYAIAALAFNVSVFITGHHKTNRESSQ